MASSTNIEKTEKEQPMAMFQGKNIHSSPVDGKLLCSFSEKTCMQRRLNHYAFCIRHVLEDKNAPFKQCKFVAKYNGQRCTNAIPVKEERIYCNSHLQVLGLVPKKSRKKKAHEQSGNTTKHIPKAYQTEMLPSQHALQNVVSKRSEKVSGYIETHKRAPEERASRTAELLLANPVLSQLVSTYARAKNHKRNLLPFYGFCSSDEEEDSDCDDDDHCKKDQPQKASMPLLDFESLSVTRRSRAAKLQRLREKIRAELTNVGKTIRVHQRDERRSDKALGLLVAAVKSSPALTTAAIHSKRNSFLCSRRRSPANKPDVIVCTAKTAERLECGRSSLPYTKYCHQHILNDSHQLLFHQCCPNVSSTSACSRPAMDLQYERPLCSVHSSGKESAFRSVVSPVVAAASSVPLTDQKPPSKKARRKPVVKAFPTQKPARTNRKTTRKDGQKSTKSERNKKVESPAVVSGKEIQDVIIHDNIENRLEYNKSNLVVSPESGDNRRSHLLAYPLNGALKLDHLHSNKNDIFENDNGKEPEIFNEDEMDVDDCLENEDWSEDLGDISPTGMLRETVLKLPPESPEPTGDSQLAKPPPISSVVFSLNSVSQGNFHNSIASNNRIVVTEKEVLRPGDIQPRVNHASVVPALRPRNTIIALPKFSTSTSLAHGLTRPLPPGMTSDYPAFRPIGPAVVKTEEGTRKTDSRPCDLNHGVPLFPLSFDPVINQPLHWGGGGKLVLNNRARPLVNSSQMNLVTFSPPSLSPHVSPQITLGTAFNFDRPTVLQHSNSPSPTLSPFSAHLPNSPHGKLLPRTLRLESRGNANSGEMHDPFFGASFDKP